MIPAPKIKVVIRFVDGNREMWKDGFPVPCMKWGNDKYSSTYGLDKTFKEEIIYEGACPEKLRILNRVQQKYLIHYLDFRSQIVPKDLDKIVATAVRGVCNRMFDHEVYNEDGWIISHMPMIEYPPHVYEFLTMFLSQEDYNRIDTWEKEFWCETNSKKKEQE